MMRRRRSAGSATALGEAISFEDVLTVVTVLLLLRIVFMVPLVNLDKAKTVAATSDLYWSRQAVHVFTHPSPGPELDPYRAAFGLQEAEGRVSREGGRIFVEAVEADSNLLVIRHVPGASSFIALRIQGHGHARSFRRGTLLWSEAEKEWFVGADTVDYGSHPSSQSMEKEFRRWTKKERGY
jgi:hypothetical protein